MRMKCDCAQLEEPECFSTPVCAHSCVFVVDFAAVIPLELPCTPDPAGTVLLGRRPQSWKECKSAGLNVRL